MTTIATLAVKLVGDTAEYTKAMSAAETKARASAAEISKSLKNIGGSISGLGLKATAGLTIPLVAAGAAAVNYASDLDETKNKVSVVFGQMSGDVLAWSQDSATAMGQSQNQALAAAGTYGNLFVTMGLGQKPAADMSMSLIQLASDLASFNNADPSEVLQAMQSGLIGQSEPMRKFGVNLNESAVALKAMEMGLVMTSVDMVKANGLLLAAEKAQNEYNIAVAAYGEDSLKAQEAAQKQAEIQQRLDDTMAGSAGDISEAAKVQARYALMLEQTTTAQGDFARTSDGLANSTRIVKAQFEDAAATLGTQLLPYALKLVQFIGDLVGKFSALTPEQQKWIVTIGAIAAAIGPVLVVVGSLISAIGAIIPIVTAVGAALLGPLGIALAAIAALVALVYFAWTNNWGGIQEKTAAVIAYIQQIIANGIQFIQDLTSGQLGALSQIWQNTFDAVMTVVTAFVNNVKLIFQAFQAAFSGDWYRFGELLRQAWDNMWTALGNVARLAFDNLKLLFTNLVQSIISAFKGINWSEVGAAITQGIASGIKNGVSAIINAAKAAAKAALDAAKGFLGIESPSKIFEMQVGMQMAAGVARGWENGLDALLQPAFGAMMPAPAMASAPSAAGGGSVFEIDYDRLAKAFAMELQKAL